MKTTIHGIVPVMITPFHEDGNIDWGGLEHLTEWYIAHGARRCLRSASRQKCSS